MLNSRHETLHDSVMQNLMQIMPKLKKNAQQINSPIQKKGIDRSMVTSQERKAYLPPRIAYGRIAVHEINEEPLLNRGRNDAR